MTAAPAPTIARPVLDPTFPDGVTIVYRKKSPNGDGKSDGGNRSESGCEAE